MWFFSLKGESKELVDVEWGEGGREGMNKRGEWLRGRCLPSLPPKGKNKASGYNYRVSVYVYVCIYVFSITQILWL